MLVDEEVEGKKSRFVKQEQKGNGRIFLINTSAIFQERLPYLLWQVELHH